LIIVIKRTKSIIFIIAFLKSNFDYGFVKVNYFGFAPVNFAVGADEKKSVSKNLFLKHILSVKGIFIVVIWVVLFRFASYDNVTGNRSKLINHLFLEI